jgi:hypothetical protein
MEGGSAAPAPPGPASLLWVLGWCRFDLGSILTRAHSQWHKTQPVPPEELPAGAEGFAAAPGAPPHSVPVAPFSGGAIVNENGAPACLHVLAWLLVRLAAVSSRWQLLLGGSCPTGRAQPARCLP